MGAGPVTDPNRKKRPSWKLASPNDKLTQGIVVSGFENLPSALALFLECGPAQDAGASGGGNGKWLQTLRQLAPITDADGRDPRVASIAFTWTGLQKMGLPADALASFSAPFSEGMYQEDRLRRLGDKINDAWQATVIDEGPNWSANIPARKQSADRTKASPAGYVGGRFEGDEREVITPTTVHALLLLYDKTDTAVEAWAGVVEQTLKNHNVQVVHRLLLNLMLDPNKIGREHFGFADGMSQPIPFESVSSDLDGGGTGVLIAGKPAPRNHWHGIPLGDILLGHNNAHNEKAPGPVVPDDAGGKARASGLKPAGAPVGSLNFGLNGSYMVVRELRQNVAAFWKSLKAAADKINQHNPSAKPVTADWLAERVIGRNIDGHLLCPSGLLAADKFNFPQNAFGFKKVDPDGHGCPLGSHVRRANPRDGQAKDLASAPTLLNAANNHRILRRGRKYGTTLKDRDQDDNAERGLLFICLNTDIARQFEFIQQRWLLNRNFATLFDETDPLIGPKGPFTINEQPLRRIVDIETFVQCAGGEYFFLPSIPALNYLASL
jgi:Dyp-type peroxidase family